MSGKNKIEDKIKFVEPLLFWGENSVGIVSIMNILYRIGVKALRNNFVACQ